MKSYKIKKEQFWNQILILFGMCIATALIGINYWIVKDFNTAILIVVILILALAIKEIYFLPKKEECK